MTRKLLGAVLLAIVPLSSACEIDIFASYPSGTYDMRWVNGRRVPAVVFESTNPGTFYRVELSYGTLHLRRDDTFSLDFEVRETDTKGVSRTTHGYSGSYEIDGPDLYLYFVDPVTNRDRTLSGFVRDGYVEVLIAGIVDRQLLQCGFER